jgi:hypothetical protein
MLLIVRRVRQGWNDVLTNVNVYCSHHDDDDDDDDDDNGNNEVYYHHSAH